MKNATSDVLETTAKQPSIRPNCRQLPPGLSLLPPWDQVRVIHHASRQGQVRCGAYPRLQLRGDRAYLRALRAAELTAWEAATRRAGT